MIEYIKHFISKKRLFSILLSIQIIILSIHFFTQMITMSHTASKEFEIHIFHDLENKCHFLELYLQEEMFRVDYVIDNEIIEKIQRLSWKTDIRITLISPDGSVTFDSHYNFNVMNNHGDRQEVTDALSGKNGKIKRFSKTMDMEFLYFSKPIYYKNVLMGVIRLSYPYEKSQATLSRITNSLLYSNLVILLLTLTITFIAIRVFTKTLRKIEGAAGEIARGNYNVSIPQPITYEMGRLFKAMAYMTREIDKSQTLLREKSDLLREISLTDELTQLGNRRKFEYFFNYQWDLCKRGKHTISFIIMDIDFFKQYNDTLGHLEGDKCLQLISKILKSVIHRTTDLLVRLGGEEFGILLTETDSKQTAVLGNKILSAIEENAIPHPSSKVKPYVTLSIGMCTIIPTDSISRDELYQSADQALYRAKKLGRNRVESSD